MCILDFYLGLSKISDEFIAYAPDIRVRLEWLTLIVMAGLVLNKAGYDGGERF